MQLLTSAFQAKTCFSGADAFSVSSSAGPALPPARASPDLPTVGPIVPAFPAVPDVSAVPVFCKFFPSYEWHVQ